MNSNLKEPLNIVFVCDDNFDVQLCVAIHSLIKHCSVPILVNIITDNESDLNHTSSILNNNGILYNIYRLSDDVFENFPQYSHIPKISYYRLLIPMIIKSSVAIYFDVDTIILGDIKELIDFKFDQTLIAGVLDPIAGTNGVENSYINAGFLIFNLTELRSIYDVSAINEAYNVVKDNMPWMDQDIINQIFKNKIKLLDVRFNMFSSKLEFPARKKNVFMIHYSGSSKPWNSWNGTYAYRLWNVYHQEIFGNILYKISNFRKIVTITKSLIPDNLKIHLKRTFKVIK